MQRNALIVSAAVTTFVLVLIGGVAAGLAQAPVIPAAMDAAPQAATEAPAAAADPAQVTPSYAVSAGQARDLALQAVPGAQVTRTPELVSYEGTPAYEVVLDQGNVYVDANTGRVLYNGATVVQSGSGPVTADQAAEIARTYLGGGTVVGVQLAEDDGRTFYVVVFDNRTLVAVNADDGQIAGVRMGGGREHEHEDENEFEHEDGESHG